MNEGYFSFREIDSDNENEILIHQEIIYQGGAAVGYRNRPIIDKKTFIECYNKWINPLEEDK